MSASMAKKGTSSCSLPRPFRPSERPDTVLLHGSCLLPRLFLAVDLPESARRGLESIQPRGVPGVRPVVPDQFHLTLHFLGEVDDTAVQPLLRSLDDVPSPALSLELAGVGQFPATGIARVLWAGCAENADLRQLHREMESRLSTAIGYRGESRLWLPHITLARVTSPHKSGLIGDWLAQHGAFRYPPVPLERWCLYRSDSGPTGPRYSVVMSRPFG